MCVSAPMSFAMSAALVPAGIYCARTAVRKGRRGLLPLALVPIALGVQQFVEGLVWVGLDGRDDALVRWASVLYLYFALAFYPMWIPFSFVCAEPTAGLRRVFGAMTLLGLAWTWLYVPLLWHPDQFLTTEVVHHSIRYDVRGVPGYAMAPRAAWRAGYLLLVSVPFLASRAWGKPNSASGSAGLVTGSLVVGTFAVCYLFFQEVFASVWCFVAAALSLLLCLVFFRLPSAVQGTPGG